MIFRLKLVRTATTTTVCPATVRLALRVEFTRCRQSPRAPREVPIVSRLTRVEVK